MSWQTAPLAEIADIERKGVDPSKIVPGTNYLGLEHIESGGKIIGCQKVQNGELASTKFQFSPHHVLYGKLRPYLAKIALPDFEGICSTDILPIKPGPRLDRKFLAYFLRQPKLVDYASSRSTGANLPRLSPKALGAFEIPLPSLEDQKRIASILDQADELLCLRHAAIAKLSALGLSIFNEMFGDPLSNPKGFQRCKLGEIVKFVGGSQPPKSTFLYEPGPDRVRLVQIRDFRTDEYRTYVPKDLAKRPFGEEDVLIGRYGPPVFQILRGLSGTYNVALMKAQPTQGVTNDFVYYLLQESKLHNYVVANSERTAGQSGVNLKLLNDYPAYLPPHDLLRQFSDCLNAHSQAINGARKHCDHLTNLFTSLQHRAFRGEL
jgi:type I restriction enzyme S subunit